MNLYSKIKTRPFGYAIQKYIVPEIAYRLATMDDNTTRIPEFERAISRDPVAAYNYVNQVIKDRWPEAEDAIMRHPYKAYLYARHILKRRWPEAEPFIAQNGFASSEYAARVLRGRFELGEPVMKKAGYWEWYKLNLERGPGSIANPQ